MLDRERAKLERLLALALTVAARDDCEPLELLAVLEDLDRIMQEPRSEPSIDKLAPLLRETRCSEAAA